MITRNLISAVLICCTQFFFCKSYEVTDNENELKCEIDSLIITDSFRPFNGQVLIAQNDSKIYSKAYGYSNFVDKSKLTKEHQFVIGSLSKQITAVLVLQAVERGSIKLNDPIKTYLPQLPMNWADVVTVHQLLNHTHGISNLDEALDYEPGTDFAYSNLGYELLGQILESVSKKTFAELCTELFKKYGMKNSSVPGKNQNFKMTLAWSRDSTGNIIEEQNTFKESYLPAAFILSTAEDLLLWNNLLHNGKLLSNESYELMISPGAVQNHPLFGTVGYGFALRINNSENIPEIGHTGYVPGYLSMNFYYPDSKINIIVLENIDWKDENIKKTFYFELKLRELIKKSKLLKENSLSNIVYAKENTFTNNQTTMSYSGLKLNFTLAYRETSKDSNSETTKIRIENGKIFIDKEYGGFKAGKNTKVEKEMGETTEKHIMEFILAKNLNTNLEELKPTDDIGISGYLKLEMFGNEPSKMYIEGKTNIWGSDDYIKQHWGEQYLKSKTNIDSIKYFRAADEFVQLVMGL